MSVFERRQLSNGLRVLAAPLPHAQSVACFVMLAAGSRYERAANRGIAHFAEHMFFKGTERRPNSRDLTTLVDGIGGEFNAFTSKEYTGYYVRCAGADRNVAFDVLLDMLRHSKFDPEEIDREKGVILEEMNMYADTPRDHIGTVYENLMFGDNPLGWGTLGTKETIKAANRDTFIDYLDEWYTPDRMVIGVSGMVGNDLDPMLEQMLGDMKSNGSKRPAPAQMGTAPGPHVSVFHKDADQAHLILGVPSIPIDHPDRYTMQLLTGVLGSGMSSRLFLEVRERRGLAYYVHGMNHSYTDAGSLLAQAGVDIKRIDEAIKVIVEQFARMATERVPDDEFEKARSMIKGRFVLRTENPQGLLMFGLNREVLEGEAMEPAELLKKIDAVTAEDVQRLAQDLIANDKLHLAVIGPFVDQDERFRKLLTA
ncbi:MAG: pitrilysin family protein [Actinomycetes bacterium]